MRKEDKQEDAGMPRELRELDEDDTQTSEEEEKARKKTSRTQNIAFKDEGNKDDDIAELGHLST